MIRSYNESVNKPNKIAQQNFIHKEQATKVIMDYGAAAAHKFRTRLEFKQYDVSSQYKFMKMVIATETLTAK